MGKAKLWEGPVYLEPIEHKYHHRTTGKIYKSVTTTLTSIEPHFDAEAEFLVEACRRGFPLREVRVKSKSPDGVPTSHYRNIRDTLRIARRVFGAWFRSVWRRVLFRGELRQSEEGD